MAPPAEQRTNGSWWNKLVVNVATGLLILIIGSSFALAVNMQIEVAVLKSKMPEVFPPAGFAQEVRGDLAKLHGMLADVKVNQAKIQVELAGMAKQLDQHQDDRSGG